MKRSKGELELLLEGVSVGDGTQKGGGTWKLVCLFGNTGRVEEGMLRDDKRRETRIPDESRYIITYGAKYSFGNRKKDVDIANELKCSKRRLRVRG